MCCTTMQGCAPTITWMELLKRSAGNPEPYIDNLVPPPRVARFGKGPYAASCTTAGAAAGCGCASCARTPLLPVYAMANVKRNVEMQLQLCMARTSYGGGPSQAVADDCVLCCVFLINEIIMSLMSRGCRIVHYDDAVRSRAHPGARASYVVAIGCRPVRVKTSARCCYDTRYSRLLRIKNLLAKEFLLCSGSSTGYYLDPGSLVCVKASLLTRNLP